MALALLSGTPAVLAQEAGSGSTVYLVRHAERAADHPSDPTLTPAGSARAALLARMLADVELVSVWSTDYRRTRLTAAPVARVHGLEVASYDPRGPGLQALLERLRSTPGHHLVVGHSNTTPAVVEALGGDPVSPIDEGEYDRLYVVVLAGSEVVSSALIRFGEPWREGGG
jgi:broad specificity phosphatase PhoE